MSAAGTTEIEATLARTARNYDQLPYESRAFAASQPSRIGGIARAFGLGAAPLATARVLELGCASGGNIIPHALRYPDASFVGVDLSSAQVEAGRARIARLGLANVDIRCESLTEIGEELGCFDYIICHGVYSWVPAAVRDAIFRIIAARLSPVGVACVSYNVLPGWRMVQPLHDAFMLEAPGDGDLSGRVARARELMGFLAETTPDKGPYGDMLRARAAMLATASDHYIAHEFMEEASHPVTVSAFAADAGRSGLGYLADCDLAFSIPENHGPENHGPENHGPENHGPEIARQIRARAKGDPVDIEQYLDLLTGRTFRQTVLVSSARQAEAERAISPESIAPLHFLTEAGIRIDWNGSLFVATDAAGRLVPIGSAAAAEGVRRLVMGFPASSSLNDCIAAITCAEPAAGRAPLIEALHRMVLAGMITLSSEPVRAGRGNAKPGAIALARADAAEGAESTTNLRHEPVTLDQEGRLLLQAMDGSLDQAALTHRLEEEALAGRLILMRDGMPVSGADAIRARAAERVPVLLAGMAHVGLLAP